MVKAPPPAVVAVYNWTGFYIGAHVGYGFGTKDWSVTYDTLSRGSHDVSGLIAGGQAGVNWQTGNWVLGIEGRGAGRMLTANTSGSPGSVTFRTKVQWLGTVAGRLGYAFDRVLVYGKGGAAFAHDEHEIADGLDRVQIDKTRWGWMAGGGIEVALVGNWSAKGEYNYMDFGKKTVNDDGLVIDQDIHVVKFGINYRFGPSPVVARY